MPDSMDGSYGGGPVEVTIIGADTARVRLNAAHMGFTNAPKVLVRSAAAKMRAALKKEAPHRTGKFAKAITYRVADEADLTTATFSAPQPLAGWIIQGTRPHDIQAGFFTDHSAKHALYWPGAEHPTAMLHHPGTKPDDFATRAYNATKGEIEALLDVTGKGILTSIFSVAA